jgi:NAD+ kinase
VIVCDERNPKATALLAGLRQRLGEDWEPHEDLAIVIGGDGFLLRTVATHGMSRAWLGLNAGNLGFLLNDAQDLDRVVTLLEAERYTIHEFPIVVAKVICADGSEVVERAVNDVYLERMTGQAARLRLVIDGHAVVEQLVADGLIFATALGSTAYAYSAGGQPLHPKLRVLQVTPICAHLPRIPSVALPADARAEVEVLQHGWRPVRAVADGRAIDHVLRVEVGLGDTGVKLAYLENHDFTGRLLRKIVHP